MMSCQLKREATWLLYFLYYGLGFTLLRKTAFTIAQMIIAPNNPPSIMNDIGMMDNPRTSSSGNGKLNGSLDISVGANIAKAKKILDAMINPITLHGSPNLSILLFSIYLGSFLVSIFTNVIINPGIKIKIAMAIKRIGIAWRMNGKTKVNSNLPPLSPTNEAIPILITNIM